MKIKGLIFRRKLARIPRWIAFAAVPALVSFFCLARADSSGNSTPLKIALPPETDSFKPGPGSALANGQCLTCHSVEYVVTQPPMSPAFWTAEVKKMREKFGATFAEDQIEPLAEYLSENYGADAGRKTAATASIKSSTAIAATTVASDEAMASKYGCLGCHNVNVKVIGPAFNDVVAKYRNDPAAIDRILEQIRNGSSGKWGPTLMPPFPMLPEAEAQALAHWVMRQGANHPGKPQ
jgi:cytochrome c551/c552